MNVDFDVHRTLGSYVVERPTRARVFERFGLDYCCGGKKALIDACAEKGLDVQEVAREIYEDDHNADKLRKFEENADWSGASMTALANHIESTHHSYMRLEMPRLVGLANKVASRHGDKRTELKSLADAVSAFTEQIMLHMMKEDTVLFPMVRELDKASKLPRFHCGNLTNPIRVMEFEHEEAGGLLEEFRRLTDNYSLPDDACNSYRALFAGLQEMEKDLHLHVHKENNILFPQALTKERELQKKHANA